LYILNKNDFFSKMKDWKVKQVLPGGLVPVGGGGYKERVKEGDYGGNVRHSCRKMGK
jgi:hypothetical protein